MATSKKAAKPAQKKRAKQPSNPARIRTPQGFLRAAIELRVMRIKGKYVSISGGAKAGVRSLYDVVKEVAQLCTQKRYHEARLLVNDLPLKSYVGLDAGLEQTIIREEVDSYIKDCQSRDAKFGYTAEVVTLDDGIVLEPTPE